MAASSSTPTAPPVAARAMRFRPCIDLHDGTVKQIVGATLSDKAAGMGSGAAEAGGGGGGGGSEKDVVENFVSTKPPKHFGEMYQVRNGSISNRST